MIYLKLLLSMLDHINKIISNLHNTKEIVHVQIRSKKIKIIFHNIKGKDHDLIKNIKNINIMKVVNLPSSTI